MMASKLKNLIGRNSPRAFTLIELLIVIGIIIILAVLATPVFKSVLDHAKATKDMSNLRQIGSATQLYMNDNSGIVFSTTTPPTPWMTQLNPKYFAAWRALESTFDTRTSSEGGQTPPVSPISYGINQNILGQSADKITKPSAFIMFAPAQASGTTVSFAGLATTAAPGVLVNTGGTPATSTPGGTATGGTFSNRQRISALFADWHCENMPWSDTGPAFTNNTSTANDPDGYYRWNLQ